MIKTSKLALKKLVKQLDAIKGRHTELVTVYVPAGYSLVDIASQLRQEQSTAENIKSKAVRKNVTSALEKILRHLTLYKKTPEHGVAIFSGNVSEKEGASDIEIWAVEPPEPVKTKMYWCDQRFVLDPLKGMLEEKEVYGMICLDRSEADIALLKGKKIEPLVHYESIVPGKTRAGGQCLVPDTLVQMSDGTIVEIEGLSNPHIVKSADLSNASIKDSPIIEKWTSKKRPVYVITTKCPRTQIESSKDHIFFKWGDSIEEISAENLKKGDYLLLPEKIPVEGKIQSLDTTALHNSYKITGEGRNFLKNKRESLGLLQRNLAKKSNVTQTAISVVELGKRDIKIKFLKSLCRNLGIGVDSFIRQFCSPMSDIKLPDILDEKLAEFVGYFSGDGSFEKERLTIHDADRQIIGYYSYLAKSIFNCNLKTGFRKNKNYYMSRIYGKPIAEFMKHNFPEIKYSRTTEIPGNVLKSPDSVLASFLRGFFDAEGYVSMSRGVGLGINNKKMARQIQIALLRFGVLASVVEYDNRRNPYSKEKRYTVSITEKTSLETFFKDIGFNAACKQKKLQCVINEKSRTSHVRQIFSTGKNVRKMIEAEGCKVSDFPKVTNFFRNERLMSKEVFRDSVLSEIKHNKGLYKRLKPVLDYGLIPSKIKSIEKVEKKCRLVDIEVNNSNFIANGLIVHNSSARFSRVREGMLNDWLKQVAESANKIFLERKDIKGILVSGSGPIKEMFLKEGYLNNEVVKNVLGTVDTSYTGEQGLEETVKRGETLIHEASIFKEKKLLERFFTELRKPNGLAVYGLESVLEKIKMGAVETIIVTEDMDEIVREYETGGKTVYALSKEKGNLIGEEDLEIFLENIGKKFGSAIVLVSKETREGKQFLELGGIGAILRYRV